MEQSLDSYVQITMELVVPSANLPGDVYIKLGDNNYVAVGRAGTKEQLKSLNFYEKIKDNLYIKKSDLKKFSALKVFAAGELMKNSRVSQEAKVDMLAQALGSVFTSVSQMGFSLESLESSKFLANSVLTVINENPKLNSLMTMMGAVSEDLTRHSIAVSMVSLLIVQSNGWNNHVNLEKLALGGILHDIGMKEYSKDFLYKPRVDYTPEDIVFHERHAFRGIEILRTVPDVPSEVMAIVAEHHENAIGQGYPKGLRDIRMHPFSKVVALADCFCELTFKDHQNPIDRDPEETVHFIETSMGQPFNKEYFRALKNILLYGVRKTIIKVV